MEAPVTLTRILKDWLNKDEFPIVSIIGWEISTDEERGQIWMGDYDIATIYDTYVEITNVFREDGNIKLHAADPEFFTKLEDSLKIYLSILKNNGDGRDCQADQPRQDHERFPR